MVTITAAWRLPRSGPQADRLGLRVEQLAAGSSLLIWVDQKTANCKIHEYHNFKVAQSCETWIAEPCKTLQSFETLNCWTWETVPFPFQGPQKYAKFWVTETCKFLRVKPLQKCKNFALAKPCEIRVWETLINCKLSLPDKNAGKDSHFATSAPAAPPIPPTATSYTSATLQSKKQIPGVLSKETIEFLPICIRALRRIKNLVSCLFLKRWHLLVIRGYEPHSLPAPGAHAANVSPFECFWAGDSRVFSDRSNILSILQRQWFSHRTAGWLQHYESTTPLCDAS